MLQVLADDMRRTGEEDSPAKALGLGIGHGRLRRFNLLNTRPSLRLRGAPRH
jgi:hypothetical protein